MPANFFCVKCVRFLPFHDHDCSSELPRFSVNFREPSGPYRKLPKMLRWPLSTFKTGVKDTNFSVFWFCWNTKSSFKAWNINCGSWIKRLSLITYLRTICLDLWARLEKLSLKYKIDVVSPQSWESRTMRESWQAYPPTGSVHLEVSTIPHEYVIWRVETLTVLVTGNFCKNNISLSVSVELQFRLICDWITNWSCRFKFWNWLY